MRYVVDPVDGVNRFITRISTSVGRSVNREPIYRIPGNIPETCWHTHTAEGDWFTGRKENFIFNIPPRHFHRNVLNFLVRKESSRPKSLWNTLVTKLINDYYLPIPSIPGQIGPRADQNWSPSCIPRRSVMRRGKRRVCWLSEFGPHAQICPGIYVI